MKVITAVLLGVLAVSNAMPKTEIQKDARFVGDLIAGILENISEQIRENGLDPYEQERISYEIGLPVPVLFDFKAFAEDISVTGISNIVINRMNYGLLTSRLDMDVVLPRISFFVGNAGIDATILGEHIDLSAIAHLALEQPRIAGRVQLNIGIISGITVREVDLRFTMRSIQFNGAVSVLGTNYSDDIRHFAEVLIPNRLKELENDINDLIEIIVRQVFETILN